MIFKSRILAAVALLYVCTVATYAQAGQLFPPAGGTVNNGVTTCPANTSLVWSTAGDNGHVVCASTTSMVNLSCPAGQVLTGVTNGSPNCVNVPACSANQQLNFNGTQFVCTPSTVPTCAANQAITFNGTSFVCVNQDPAVPTCAAGQFLTYNGVAFQCSGTQSVSIPSCGANQYVTSNGSQFFCVNLPTGSNNASCPPIPVDSTSHCFSGMLPVGASMQTYILGDFGGTAQSYTPDAYAIYQCQNGAWTLLLAFTPYWCGVSSSNDTLGAGS